MSNKNLYVLVGAPASGKSSFAENFSVEHCRKTVISYDNIILNEMKKDTDNLDYENFIKNNSIRLYQRYLTEILSAKEYINTNDIKNNYLILDSTNLLESKRKMIYDIFSDDGWNLTIIPFVLSKEIIHKNLNHREKTYCKLSILDNFCRTDEFVSNNLAYDKSKRNDSYSFEWGLYDKLKNTLYDIGTNRTLKIIPHDFINMLFDKCDLTYSHKKLVEIFKEVKQHKKQFKKIKVIPYYTRFGFGISSLDKKYILLD